LLATVDCNTSKTSRIGIEKITAMIIAWGLE